MSYICSVIDEAWMDVIILSQAEIKQAIKLYYLKELFRYNIFILIEAAFF